MRQKKLRLHTLGIITSSILSIISSSTVLASTLLVSNVLSNSISLFDESQGTLIKTLKVGFMPHEVVVSPNGSYALVSNFGDITGCVPGKTLSVIDIANAKVAQTIQLPDKSRPHGIVFISNDQALVTAQGIKSLLLVNIKTGVIENKVALPHAGAHVVCVDAQKRFAYIASMDTGVIYKIDLGSFTIVSSTSVGSDAEGITLTAENDLVLVTNRKENSLSVLKAGDLSLVKKLTTENGPARISMFNNGKTAAFTNTLSGTVQTLDISSLTITHSYKTLPSGLSLNVPVNIFIRDDKHTAYITNFFANKVALLDLDTGEVIKTIHSGNLPDGVAVSPVTAK